MPKEVKKDGVKFHSEHGGYYYYGSYQTQAVLQRQQYKMEANPSAYKTKYAVEYYKMWTFDEGYNGLMINQHVDGPMVHSLLF